VIDLVENRALSGQNTRPSPSISSLFTTSRPSELASLLSVPTFGNKSQPPPIDEQKETKENRRRRQVAYTLDARKPKTHSSLDRNTSPQASSRTQSKRKRKTDSQLYRLSPLSCFPQVNQRRSRPPSSQPSRNPQALEPDSLPSHQPERLSQSTIQPSTLGKPDLKGRSFPSGIIPLVRV
jgi:hypothetical protein